MMQWVLWSRPMLFTVYPADNNGLEETTPEQRHSAGGVVVEQLENVDATLRTCAHAFYGSSRPMQVK